MLPLPLCVHKPCRHPPLAAAQRRCRAPPICVSACRLSTTLASQVQTQREAIRAVLDGSDPRLLVVVGPCSLHDPMSALEYADRLAALTPR